MLHAWFYFAHPILLATLVNLLGGNTVSAVDLYFDTSAAPGLTSGSALWDSGSTSAWAASPSPGTAEPGLWTDGDTACFHTSGTSTVTLASPVTAQSIQHQSGTTTLVGTGVLELTNGVTLSGGTLNVGSGVSGRLPYGSGITMSSGTSLNFGRTDTTTWSGRINGVTAADGMVSKTGSGDLTLALQGNNAFGTLRTTSTAGLLTLATAATTDQINAMLRSASGSTMAITSGIWSAPNLGVNASGNQLRGVLRISDSTLTVPTDYQPDPNAGLDIAHGPQSTGTLAGQEVYLSVVATGEGELSYQWRKDGVPIDGATGPNYIVGDATLADVGSYDVIVTDATGRKTTPAAELAVAPAGSIDPLVAASAYRNESVWSYHDSAPVPWSLFKARDYGSSQIAFDGQDVTPPGRVPAPGVHPRVFFSSADLPGLRQRIQTTTGSQEAWKNLLSCCHVMKRTYDKNQDYAKPWWYVNYFGFTGRNPNIYRINGVSTENYYDILANGGTPASFASEPSFFFKAASMEALRCLIEEDAVGGEKLARAVVRSIQIEQARRAVADSASTPPKPSTPRAKCSSLGLVYDFAYNFMTPAQQDFVRQELVLLSAWADNYGTFNNAEARRSNWATFSYSFFDILGSLGGALTTPADLVAAKFLYPNDKLVDFSYRSLIKDDYRNIPSASTRAVRATARTGYRTPAVRWFPAT